MKTQVVLDRNLIHMANIFSQTVGRGENYDKAITCCQYNFNSFQTDDEYSNEEIIDEYSMCNKNGNVFSEKFKIYTSNLENSYNIWYHKNINKYKKSEQEIIKLGALMTISVKADFYKCLSQINAPQKVKTKIKKIVERWNDNMEIREYYYDWKEEQRRINDGIIAENQRKAIKEASEKGMEKGLEKGKKSIIQKFIDSGMSKKEVSNILEISTKDIDNLLNS